MKQLFTQQINSSSEITYGWAIVAVILVAAVFIGAFKFAKSK